MSVHHTDADGSDDPAVDTGDQPDVFVGIRCPDCQWFLVVRNLPTQPDDCALCGEPIDTQHVTADALFGAPTSVRDATGQREFVETAVADIGEAFVHGSDLDRVSVASALHQAADLVETGGDE